MTPYYPNKDFKMFYHATVYGSVCKFTTSENYETTCDNGDKKDLSICRFSEIKNPRIGLCSTDLEFE